MANHTDNAVTTIEQIAERATSDILKRALQAPQGPPRYDEIDIARAVGSIIDAGGRGRSVEMPLRRIERSTTINGDAVADITVGSLVKAKSPRLADADDAATAAPLVTRLGEEVDSPDLVSVAEWPSGPLAGRTDDVAGTKPAFNSVNIAMSGSTVDVFTEAVVIDVSAWAAAELVRIGRWGQVLDFIRAEVLRGIDAEIAKAIAAAAPAKATDLGAALDAIKRPFGARIIAGPYSALEKLDIVRLGALGLEVLHSADLAAGHVVDPRAVTVVHSPMQLLMADEPNLAGLLVSVSARVGIHAAAAGLATLP